MAWHMIQHAELTIPVKGGIPKLTMILCTPKNFRR